MKILVFCGGDSAEKLVSLASGDAVAQWIADAGHHVKKYDPAKPGVLHTPSDILAPTQIGALPPTPNGNHQFDPRIVRGILDVIEQEQPDLIFPILHGGWGEDGRLQALLEWVNVPFANSGSLASAIAMNKSTARILFDYAGVPVARGALVNTTGENAIQDCCETIEDEEFGCGYPAVIKPCSSGSAVGVNIAHNKNDVADALKNVALFDREAVVEEFFRGRELTVTVVNGIAYPVIEIRPHDGFYDYHNKYTAGRTDYLCPAPISNDATIQLQEDAQNIYDVVDCRGVVRIDFMMNDDEEYICLEVNTLPGMTATSLVPKAAMAIGETPVQLMQKLIDAALRR